MANGSGRMMRTEVEPISAVAGSAERGTGHVTKATEAGYKELGETLRTAGGQDILGALAGEVRRAGKAKDEYRAGGAKLAKAAALALKARKRIHNPGNVPRALERLAGCLLAYPHPTKHRNQRLQCYRDVGLQVAVRARKKARRRRR